MRVNLYHTLLTNAADLRITSHNVTKMSTNLSVEKWERSYAKVCTTVDIYTLFNYE